MRNATLLLLLSGMLHAQSPASIAPAWDVRVLLQQLADQTARFKSVVDQLRIGQWIEKGASETYRQQQQVVQAEIGYLNSVTSGLTTHPERLTLVIDAYFRLQSIEGMTSSLADGATRYQDQQTAESLQALLSANAASRTKLRQYMTDLAAAKEQEFAIAEKEAQRCQAEINRNPLAPPPPVPRPTGKSK